MIGISIIRNKVNGKVYIGQSWNIKSRIADHKRNLKNNKCGNIHLQRAYNKYGVENFEFEVLADLSYIKMLNKDVAQIVLDENEKYWIDYFGGKDCNDNYNIREGGWGGTYSEEHKIKMSKLKQGKFSGELNPMYGKHHSEYTKQLISKNRKGKGGKHFVMTEEQKQKISKANKGKVVSKEVLAKRKAAIRELMKNPEYRKRRKEAGIKIGISNRKYSDEFVLQLRKENSEGMSIKKLSQKYNIPFESCRIMIKGERRFANIK